MITPHDILTLAKTIERAARTEAEYRNCVGRAYYAAFLTAERYRDTRHVPFARVGANGQRLGSHEQVIDSVQHFGAVNALFFQNQLDTLKHLRRRADYKINLSISRQEARHAVLDADAFIQWVDHLP